MKDKEWEVECLASKIKEVEMSKKEKPELYAKAVKYLKKEASVIESLEDLKEVAMKGEEDEGEED